MTKYSPKCAHDCMKLIKRCDDADVAIQRCNDADKIVAFDKHGNPIIELSGDDAKIALGRIKGEYEQTLDNLCDRLKSEFGVEFRI